MPFIAHSISCRLDVEFGEMSADGAECDDLCSVCDKLWTEGDSGWPLCDTPNCENVVCAECTTSMQLSVGELFYCPECAGGERSAAAVAGGALTSATLGLFELAEPSRAALVRVIRNIRETDDPKFKRLRLGNRKVKETLDVPAARRVLDYLGFAERICEEETWLECDVVDAETFDDLLALLEALRPEEQRIQPEERGEKRTATAPPEQ